MTNININDLLEDDFFKQHFIIVTIPESKEDIKK